MTDEPTTAWRKSSRSASNDQCVEILGTLNAARDSKHPADELHFTGRAPVRALLRMLKR